MDGLKLISAKNLAASDLELLHQFVQLHRQVQDSAQNLADAGFGQAPPVQIGEIGGDIDLGHLGRGVQPLASTFQKNKVKLSHKNSWVRIR